MGFLEIVNGVTYQFTDSPLPFAPGDTSLENFYVSVADIRRDGKVVVGLAPLLTFLTNEDIEDMHSMGIASIGRHTWSAAGVGAGGLWRQDGVHGGHVVNARNGWSNNGNWERACTPPARTYLALDDPQAERTGACAWVRNVLKRDKGRSPSKPRVVVRPAGPLPQSGVRWTAVNSQ